MDLACLQCRNSDVDRALTQTPGPGVRYYCKRCFNYFRIAAAVEVDEPLLLLPPPPNPEGEGREAVRTGEVLHAVVQSPGRAVAFVFGPEDDRHLQVRVEHTNVEKNLWAVRHGGDCFNCAGEWEWESMPSSRKEAFLAETRFSLTDAIELAQTAVAKLLAERAEWVRHREQKDAEK